MTGNLGDTRSFILGRGWTQVEDMFALRSADGTLRFFFLLETHPDDPRVQIQEAWRTFFEALPPGGSGRILLFQFPEEEERRRFLEQVQGWNLGGQKETREAWREEMVQFLLDAPLPFHRQVLLEVTLSPGGSVDFLRGLPQLFARYGVEARMATPEEVEALARKILHPEV